MARAKYTQHEQMQIRLGKAIAYFLEAQKELAKTPPIISNVSYHLGLAHGQLELLQRYMPRKPDHLGSALTPGQRRLRKKHGTPAEFAVACYRAVGEVSMDEANVAIAKYQKEWDAA